MKIEAKDKIKKLNIVERLKSTEPPQLHEQQYWTNRTVNKKLCIYLFYVISMTWLLFSDDY